MPKFIDFTSSTKNKHSGFALGNPVHDEELPKWCIGASVVRVDGREVDFADESMSERIHRALVEGKSIQDRKGLFDCVTFAALMMGKELGQPGANGHFDFVCTNDKISVDPEARLEKPVDVGIYNHIVAQWDYPHSMYPAHTVEDVQYIHKLGTKGPLCLSGLADGIAIYRATVAHPMTSLTVSPQQQS